jgi:multidrug efflux pump subunit AcrA (membrane-fusion protein)
VAKVSAAPLGGKFEVRFDLEGAAEGLVPGMTASVRVVTARKEDALSVPASAVFTDDDGETRYVYLAGKGKPEKRTVKVGITAGDRVEIVEGLAEGDAILPTKP